VVELERKGFPGNFEPQVGQRLELTQEDDSNVLVTVVALTDTHITSMRTTRWRQGPDLRDRSADDLGLILTIKQVKP